jgi:predicted PurR-regulated permease PerM
MKNLKPFLILFLLIIILFFAIREKHTIEKIINNLLYQDERLQTKTIHH